MYKLVLLGDSGVGKSNVLSRFTSDVFSPSAHPTIAFDLSTVAVEVPQISPPPPSAATEEEENALPPDINPNEGHPTSSVQVQVWDTAGQERFHAFPDMVFRGVHGAIVVFDLSSRESFEHVDRWVSELRSRTLENKVNPNVLILGNKCDLVHLRCVDRSEGMEKARQLSASYLEASALTSECIQESFVSLVSSIHRTWGVRAEGKELHSHVSSGRRGGVGGLFRRTPITLRPKVIESSDDEENNNDDDGSGAKNQQSRRCNGCSS